MLTSLKLRLMQNAKEVSSATFLIRKKIEIMKRRNYTNKQQIAIKLVGTEIQQLIVFFCVCSVNRSPNLKLATLVRQPKWLKKLIWTNMSNSQMKQSNSIVWQAEFNQLQCSLEIVQRKQKRTLIMSLLSRCTSKLSIFTRWRIKLVIHTICLQNGVI